MQNELMILVTLSIEETGQFKSALDLEFSNRHCQLAESDGMNFTSYLPGHAGFNLPR